MPPSRPPTAREPAQDDCLQNAVEALTGEVHTLAEHVEVLRVAIDDLRAEVEFAVRNLARPAWAPTQPLTSMPIDPVAENFPINRTRRDEVPINGAKASSPTEPFAPTPGVIELPTPRRKRKPKSAVLF